MLPWRNLDTVIYVFAKLVPSVVSAHTDHRSTTDEYEETGSHAPSGMHLMSIEVTGCRFSECNANTACFAFKCFETVPQRGLCALARRKAKEQDWCRAASREVGFKSQK